MNHTDRFGLKDVTVTTQEYGDVIPVGEFLNCISLKKVIIESGIRTIDNNAFTNCINLETIVIPNTVETINEEAFHRCIRLNSITLSDNIRYIGNMCFDKCINLKEIYIPDSIQRINFNAFDPIYIKRISIPSRFKSRHFENDFNVYFHDTELNYHD